MCGVFGGRTAVWFLSSEISRPTGCGLGDERIEPASLGDEEGRRECDALAGVGELRLLAPALALQPSPALISWWVWAFVAEYFLLFFTFPYTMFAQYMQWGKYNNDNYPLLKNGGYL